MAEVSGNSGELPATAGSACSAGLGAAEQGIVWCPFCHSMIVRPRETELALWRVKCHTCGAESGHCMSREDAVYLWNHRA